MGELERAGSELTETSFVLGAGLTFEQWAEMGDGLGQMHRSLMWWIGDWYLYGEAHYGHEAEQAVPLGYSSESIRQAAWVCQRFPPEERRADLSYTHHRHVSRSDIDPVTRVTLLDQAAAEGWSSRELHERLPARNGADTEVRDLPIIEPTLPGQGGVTGPGVWAKCPDCERVFFVSTAEPLQEPPRLDA